MKVAILGLGYVGAVTAGCLARLGHDVVGVDVDSRKVRLLQKGEAPFAEPGLGELLLAGRQEGRLNATQHVQEALTGTDVVLISVGTPSRHDGMPDTSQITRVLQEIGEQLRGREGEIVIGVRSTVPPGTMEQLAIPLLERTSERKHGEGFHVCFNPEFLREGVAVEDFLAPARTIVGGTTSRAIEVMKEVYAEIDAPFFAVRPRVAELVKYVDNIWHAIKVAFANEMGTVARHFAADAEMVTRLFLADEKLNLSAYYLSPGAAFGGSCLPKDVRAMVALTARTGVTLPLMGSILRSNEAHLERMVSICLEAKPRSALLAGLSFKGNTDDLRESPFLFLAERLLGKGVQLRVYDTALSLEDLHGSNMAFLYEHVPHIARLLVKDPVSTVDEVDTVIVAKKDDMMRDIVRHLTSSHSVVDLVGLAGLREGPWEYHGLCWQKQA